METLLSRKSVHSFRSGPLPPEAEAAAADALRRWDAAAGPLGTHPRVIECASPLRCAFVAGKYRCAIASHFRTRDSDAMRRTRVDLGFKIYCVTAALARAGIASCVCAAADADGVRRECRRAHAMEYDAPVMIAFGAEDPNPARAQRLRSWMHRDSARAPLSAIARVENCRVPQIGALLEAVRRAPSEGNAQNWRVLAEGDAVHFYCASEAPLRDVNVGCALGALWCAAECAGVRGEWAVVDRPPANEGEYVVSWVCSKK